MASRKVSEFPSQQRLNELFKYEKDTGRLIRHSTGAYAERDHPEGYYAVGADGGWYLAHRIIWVMHFGPIPKGLEIDHDDRDKHNNRLTNLKLVTRQRNARNLPMMPRNRSGINGVRFSPRYSSLKPWRAHIGGGKNAIQLGGFATKEEAVACRKAAEKRFGYHPNHGNKKAAPEDAAFTRTLR